MAVTGKYVYITSDNFIRVIGLKGLDDGIYISTADVTMTLQTDAGLAITNAEDISLTFKAAQNFADNTVLEDTGRGEVKILLAGHGFQVGDCIEIEGAPETEYNDIWPITAVSDHDHFNIKPTWTTFVLDTFTSVDTCNACGIYEGVLIDTLVITENTVYDLDITCSYDSLILTLRQEVTAKYKSV